MNNKLIPIAIGAVVGMIVAVLVVNSGMEPDTNTFNKLDPVVEWAMADVFKSPPPVTEHGWNVDRMIVFVHLLMGVLFIGWTIYFLYCIWAFRSSNHPKAEPQGPSKVATTVAEYCVIVAEVVLIASFAVPLWADVVNEEKLDEIKKAAATDEGLEIHILGRQFNWCARYAGLDKKFAEQSIEWADKGGNPFGLNRDDSGNYRDDTDDITVETATQENPIMIPMDTPVALKITSMDVIHSFKVLPLRVCKDAIPGLQLPIHFNAKTELLKESMGDKEVRKNGYVYLITCAQLCGDGHGQMAGIVKIVPKEEFNKWIAERSPKNSDQLAQAGQ